MYTHNNHTGWGTQNNNHSGTQNVNYGDGQIGQVLGGEVHFVKHFNTTDSTPLKSLSDAIAGVGASHKAEHQFSRGACLKDTRKSALASIHDWASAKGPEASPICWLSGAAGVGKSAIALSIAKSFEDQGLLSSSFFFFRSDPKRNTPSALVPTIAYDLAITTPLMQNCIEETISADCRILEASLEEQFRKLIIAPTLVWNRQRSLWGAPVAPNVIIIDGLDECGDEDIQLRVLTMIKSAYCQHPDFPLRFLVCSRPEAWIQEAFSDDTLSRLSSDIILDDSLEARTDIRRYFVHHFRKIATSHRYRQVRFPSPWPSKQDLEILVERSCAQFVYASTLVKFIKLAYSHPIVQLSIILDITVAPRPSRSPYHDLDCLYQVILSANPIQDELILILAAVLILPDHKAKPTPAVIEAVLGLPSGQVDLTLRGMYSVLKIDGWEDEITLYHTSFQEYLVDRTRSCIDLDEQKHTIAHRWLQSLSIDRLWSSSEGQVHNHKQFDGGGWISLCMSFSQPTWGLLDDLRGVDLAAVFYFWVPAGKRCWKGTFEKLKHWVRGACQVALHNNQWKDISGDDDLVRGSTCHTKSSDPCHLSHGMVVTDKWDVIDLENSLTRRLQGLPTYFHVKWHPGAEPQCEIVYEVVRAATECPYDARLGTGSVDWDQQPVLLSECHCDLTGGRESRDPRHIAYQDACLEFVKALTSKFAEEIARGNGLESSEDSIAVQIFCNLVESALLKHCRLTAELLSLCRTFFDLVKGYPRILGSGSDGLGKESLVEWIETFPETFAEEGKALKAQVLALPWPDHKWYHML
ncbi:hypothetical protein PM082_020864 [Marasmius tenuissimus]|nr:hypothetical protein PM082_020864 [Marasmius tenuissimus]